MSHEFSVTLSKERTEGKNNSEEKKKRIIAYQLSNYKAKEEKREYQINFLIANSCRIPWGKDFNAIPPRGKNPEPAGWYYNTF